MHWKVPRLTNGESVESLPNPPWEWQQADLQALIDNEIAEDLHIEYKESRLLAREPQSAKDACVGTLTKTVSAFNNSDSGVLVIGMQERRKDNKNCPESFDEGVYESDFSKTWLVQIINSNISPSIPDLRVNLVKLAGKQEGKVACVIYVPKGTRAVQAKDLLYYQRVEDQSLPMRDFQIRDVNNRSLGPDLRMFFIIPSGQSNQLTVSNERDKTNPFRIAVVASNLSDTLAELALFRIILPDRLDPSKPEGFDEIDINPRIHLQYKGREIDAYSKIYSRYYRAPESPPIFKELQPTVVGLLDITFRAQYQTIPHFEPLLWVAESPKMEPRCGGNILITDGKHVELTVDQEARITLDGMEPLDYWRQPANIKIPDKPEPRIRWI
ncbi:MAG: ATP-binding protein [Dehalococcoidia bacterium]|nr:MAG: ATP-binding protein [Dehalococcoidia bacterium]